MKESTLTQVFSAVVFAGLVALVPGLSADDNPLSASLPSGTLKDIYSQALANSEKIAISEQSVLRAEALYRQTMGTAFPDISFQHDTLWQQRRGTQTNGAFQIRKTGLTGYRELAALRTGRSLIEQSKQDKRRIEQLLLVDVAAAFYGLVQAQENVLSTDILIKLANDRLSEVRDRVRVGMSRDAEAIQQDYQITALQSQREGNERAMTSFVDLLAYLAGRPVPQQLAAEIAIPVKVGTLENYLGRINERPDVQSARAQVDVAKGTVRFVRGDYFPKIDLGLNLYAYRPETYKDTKWDASLGVSVPLWAWGARGSAVNAALADFRTAEETFRFVLRQAELEVRNAYRDLLSAQKQGALQQKAVELARRDYKIQLRDDRQGLVTSLEVLESLNRLNLAELSLTNFRIQARLAALDLEIAAGATPDEVLR